MLSTTRRLGEPGGLLRGQKLNAPLALFAGHHCLDTRGRAGQENTVPTVPTWQSWHGIVSIGLQLRIVIALIVERGSIRPAAQAADPKNIVRNVHGGGFGDMKRKKNVEKIFWRKKMLTKTKKRENEFNLLDEKVVEAIPDLRDPDGLGKPVHEASSLREKLQKEKKRIIGELANCSEMGPVGPITKFSTEKDVETLLAGTPVSVLTAPVQESYRSGLLRQLRAVNSALPAAQERVRTYESNLIAEQANKLKSIDAVRSVFRDTIEAAENLLECLRTQEQLCTLIRKRGFKDPYGNGWWNFQPLEFAWLKGDIHRPSLEFYIESRAGSIGLAREKISGS